MEDIIWAVGGLIFIVLLMSCCTTSTLVIANYTDYQLFLEVSTITFLSSTILIIMWLFLAGMYLNEPEGEK